MNRNELANLTEGTAYIITDLKFNTHSFVGIFRGTEKENEDVTLAVFQQAEGNQYLDLDFSRDWAAETVAEYINEMLAEHNIKPLTPGEVRDWDIRGGETTAQLQEWVNDFVSELHTERCEAKQSHRYQP